MRKVVQIAVSTDEDSRGGRVDYLYALCDDGSLWVWEDGSWHSLEDVPGGEEQENL